MSIFLIVVNKNVKMIRFQNRTTIFSISHGKRENKIQSRILSEEWGLLKRMRKVVRWLAQQFLVCVAINVRNYLDHFAEIIASPARSCVGFDPCSVVLDNDRGSLTATMKYRWMEMKRNGIKETFVQIFYEPAIPLQCITSMTQRYHIGGNIRNRTIR